MKNKVPRYAIFIVLFFYYNCQAQTIWFGTTSKDNIISQARFEVIQEKSFQSIIYAPYGISPIAFKNIKQDKQQLSFDWQLRENFFHCNLAAADSVNYKGICKSKDGRIIEIVFRHFSKIDADMQGESIKAGEEDLRIIDRALILLNDGRNWNRKDDRICDRSDYPYQWSLFCALHQASIDVAGEYRHLRHAMQATRKAINEVTNNKQYAHTLRDFNNEAADFAGIKNVLQRAKEIIRQMM